MRKLSAAGPKWHQRHVFRDMLDKQKQPYSRTVSWPMFIHILHLNVWGADSPSQSCHYKHRLMDESMNTLWKYLTTQKTMKKHEIWSQKSQQWNPNDVRVVRVQAFSLAHWCRPRLREDRAPPQRRWQHVAIPRHGPRGTATNRSWFRNGFLGGNLDFFLFTDLKIINNSYIHHYVIELNVVAQFCIMSWYFLFHIRPSIKLLSTKAHETSNLMNFHRIFHHRSFHFFWTKARCERNGKGIHLSD